MNHLHNRIVRLLAGLTLALGALVWLLLLPQQLSSQPVPDPQDKIDPALLAEMESSQPGQTLRFIVRFEATAVSALKTVGTTEVERRASLVNQLQQTADDSQAAVQSQLEVMQQTGKINAFRSFWIVNGIAIQGTTDAVWKLANRPDVLSIQPDRLIDTFDPLDSSDKYQALLQGTAALNAPLTAPNASWGIERIGAPHVWYGLGMTGEGVSVAIVDTGVDWQHPDLQANYRGRLPGGGVDHSGNWYHAALPDIVVPTDTIGHGTHVAGTAVGQNGIGVAPGSQWLAVAIADKTGVIYESSVHAAFQWLLTPAGDPALAPDVVNNSWGGEGTVTVFGEDVAVLQASGIIPVFAAGNAGPEIGSISAPGSYPNTLSVGASDDVDKVTWFSGRGPSLLTDEVKPWLVAPGAKIVSSLPGGQYGRLNGTSMATPHAVGAIALLLSANPNLDQITLNQVLADTAVPIDAVHPNANTGWGRLDVYTAVSTQATSGRLSGLVHDGGVPLANVTISVTTESGARLTFPSDASGYFEAILQPGSYDVTVNTFGYVNYTAADLTVTTNQATQHDIALTPLATGQVEGVVRDAATNAPLPDVTISVSGTPLTTTTDANGRYAFALPAGSYELVANSRHHKLGRAIVMPVLNSNLTRDFVLQPAPSILLVDSGRWYYASQAAHYGESLTALDRSFATWSIRDPFADVPGLDDLRDFDTVIWTAPIDSPGYIGANNVITDYLGLGGNLLISGQDVGRLDGSGLFTQVWWYRDLQGIYASETAVTQTITGAPDTLFDGLTIQLNEGSSAQNQTNPDVTRPRPFGFSVPAFQYPDGQAAGLQAGFCRSFRMVYLGFGLEGVSEAADRKTILSRSFDYFDTPRNDNGAVFLPQTIDDYAIAGSELAYTVTLRNTSETVTDTFQIQVESGVWASALVTPTLTLGPCQAAQTVVKLTFPSDLQPDSQHTTTVTAVSTNQPATTAQLTITHKAPGQVLFVDDDRWYNKEDTLLSALDALGINYDVWNVGHDEQIRGSPSVALLSEYDYVIWYTGYDWFAPVTLAENAALAHYLAQGGRLFLTSQDFLYYHHETELARRYFGVADYVESIAPERLYGGQNPGEDDALAGPLAQDYGPYQNHADGVIPSADSRPFFWHDEGMPAGTATSGPQWRAVFWGVPFETLSPADRVQAMNRIFGWLGDLGYTTFTVNARAFAAGEPQLYQITVPNASLNRSHQVSITNQLPPEINVIPRSLTNGVVYDATTRRLTWQGTIAPGDAQQIIYGAVISSSLPPGTPILNQLNVAYAAHNNVLTRTVTSWISAPDLTATTLTTVTDAPLAAKVVTVTAAIQNQGLSVAENISGVIHLPVAFTSLITDSITASSGVSQPAPGRIYWQGSLAPGQTATITFALTRDDSVTDGRLPITAVLHDGVTSTIHKAYWVYLPVYKQYLPLTIQK